MQPGVISLPTEEPLHRTRAVAEESLCTGSRDRRGNALPSENTFGQPRRRVRDVSSVSAESDRRSIVRRLSGYLDLAEY